MKSVISVSGSTWNTTASCAAINDYTSGVLRIEASRDGKSWLRVAALDDGRRAGTTALPDAVFPAKEIFVRLSLAGPSGRLQVNALDYEAALAERIPDGETRLMK